MKRLVVYYSLSGNTEAAAEKIAKAVDADLLKVETVKEMPKAFFSQMIVGGGQVMMKYIPELKPLDKDANDYDEIILGSPIWNSKGVPAINAFLKDENAAAKVKYLFFLSGGGEVKKGLEAITKLLPNLEDSVSLLDKKHKDSVDNDAKIEEFVKKIVG